MGTETRVYLVLHRDETRSAFEKAAGDLGFVHYQTYPGDGERKLYEQVWATPDQTSAVSYVEDPLLSPRYIYIRGVDAADVDIFVMDFAEKLAVEDREDGLELAAGATGHDNQVYSLARLAILFPEFDPRAYQIFEAYATQPPHPLLRECAVDMMGIRPWPQFKPLLRRIAVEDPAENVREHAKAILAEWPVAEGEES